MAIAINSGKNFNFNLEALRGFAAISVFIYHLIIYPEFNLGFDFRKEIFPYAPPGHLMVMVFFMLSGYVIGLSKSKFCLKEYIKKRLVRLYPIYLIAILITIILFNQDLHNTVGSLLFLQNFLTDNLTNNKPLWSLNHEIIYYITAIPIMFFGIRPLIVILFLLISLGISLWIFPFYAIIEAYMVGFIFWLIGFYLSQQKREYKSYPNKLLSVLVLLSGYDYINIISVILSRIPQKHGEAYFMHGMVNFGDLASIPVCIYALILFAGVNLKWEKILFYVIYSSSFLHLGYLLISGSFFKTNVFVIPAILVMLSLVIYYLKDIKISFRYLIWLGSISYALYVIHAPILFAFESIKFWGGNFPFFIIRTAVIMFIVIVLSYFLEKKYQPYIRKLFFGIQPNLK